METEKQKKQVLTILSKSDEVGKRNTLSRGFKGGEYFVPYAGKTTNEGA